MKIFFLYLFFLPLPLLSEITNGDLYLRDQRFMNKHEVQKRWGAKSFSPKAFQIASTAERASMTGDLLKADFFRGKTVEEVKNLLGDFTGYFWSDATPAYLIEEGWNTEQDSWQIVLLPDETGRIGSVKVHRNCCQR